MNSSEKLKDLQELYQEMKTLDQRARLEGKRGAMYIAGGSGLMLHMAEDKQYMKKTNDVDVLNTTGDIADLFDHTVFNQRI